MRNLSITLIQAPLQWEDREANRAYFARQLSSLSGLTDLVVLPEMFTTGFTMSARRLGEPMDGPTMNWLAEQAALVGAVLTGSFIAEENGRYFNRLIWMRPDGTYQHYDKRHLFTLSNEQDYYQAGSRRLIVDLHGWRVLPLICYDLRFPVWSRNTDDYDLLLYVANWPERRRHAWRSLLLARAIENQAYTIGVNRIGDDGNGIYHSGDSSVIDFAGEVRTHIAHQEQCHTVQLFWQAQQEFRQRFRFLDDRDAFQLSGIG